MRVLLTGCAILALAACQPAIPDSAAGVGFDNAIISPTAQKQRDQSLAGAAVPPAQAVSEETLATLQRTSTTATSAARDQAVATMPVQAAQASVEPRPLPVVAAVTTTAVAATPIEPASPTRSTSSQPQTTPDGVVHASPSNPAPMLMNNPGLSDENNFAAVGSRRSIDADAERLANARANYKVIEPTAVPTRQGSGPNVVSYALTTKHAVGTKMYSRVGLNSASRAKKACARYASSNKAQSVFLAKGGPRRDRLGLDPDGDGFACKWDPSLYRNAAGG